PIVHNSSGNIRRHEEDHAPISIKGWPASEIFRRKGGDKALPHGKNYPALAQGFRLPSGLRGCGKCEAQHIFRVAPVCAAIKQSCCFPKWNVSCFVLETQ